MAIVNCALKSIALTGVIGVCLVFVGAQPGMAQVSAPHPTPQLSDQDDLAPVRDLIHQGRWNDAWASLATMRRSAPALELRAQVALQLDRPQDALAAWDQLRSLGGNAEPVLERIALYTTRKLLTSSDVLVQLESERLLASLDDKEARNRLHKRMDDGTSSSLERAAAASALASLGDKAAASKFALLAQSVPARDRFNVIRLTAGLPDDVALKVLVPMLRNERSDVRYSAVVTLAERRSAEVTRILRDFLVSPPEGAARLAAMLALAAQGDRTMIAELGKLAADFGSREMLAYARALMAVGDRQANHFIGLVQNGDDQLLRLEAAALLAQTSAQSGRDLLVGALGDPSVWVRMRALELLRETRPEPNAFAHLLVAPEDWVRLRSAELTLVKPAAPVRRTATP
jgi:HEAT repeat protein